MKKLMLSLIVIAILQLSFTGPDMTGDVPESFYDFKMKAIDGSTVDFNTFKGKKVLLVNVASKCGYTPQYEDLQKIARALWEQSDYSWFSGKQFWETGTWHK